jgi:hypothetical protein
LVHHNLQANPEALLAVGRHDREDIVVGVEWILTWSWLADLCAQEGMPFVLGPARYMHAMHGGTAKHDTIDAHTMAVLRRGGMLPQADVSPAEMRATRDLWRRRMSLMRQRAALLTQVQQTNSQYNRPQIGKQLA